MRINFNIYCIFYFIVYFIVYYTLLIVFIRRIGVTQFSPTYARRAFPCMDEPYLKAKFQLHIGHHKDQNATSNTPVESIRRELVYNFFNFIKLRNIWKGIRKIGNKKQTVSLLQ